MFKEIIESNLFIDFSEEILYGSDQAYVGCPRRFPTVTFQLMSTDMLDSVMMQKRAGAGFWPDELDMYEYTIGIHGYTEHGVDGWIEGTVCNSNRDDDGKIYRIPVLAEWEREAVYACLDAQCRTHLGKSCAELLEEAGKEMG